MLLPKSGQSERGANLRRKMIFSYTQVKDAIYFSLFTFYLFWDYSVELDRLFPIKLAHVQRCSGVNKSLTNFFLPPKLPICYILDFNSKIEEKEEQERGRRKDREEEEEEEEEEELLPILVAC